DLDTRQGRAGEVEAGAVGGQCVVAGAAHDRAARREIRLIDREGRRCSVARLEDFDTGESRAGKVELCSRRYQRVVRAALAQDRTAGGEIPLVNREGRPAGAAAARLQDLHT